MRDVKRCDACGLAGRAWVRFAVMRDGRLVLAFVLCIGCADDAETAVRGARRAA